MNRYVTRALWFTAFTGGLWATGVGVASAAEPPGDESVTPESQALIEVDAPVTISGDAISGTGEATEADTSPPIIDPGISINLDAIEGVLSGTQAAAAVSAPVTVAGNAVSVLGDASSAGSQVTPSAPASEPVAPDATTSGLGVGSGVQTPLQVEVPLTVSGNAVSITGDAVSTASTVSTPAASTPADGAAAAEVDDAGICVGSGVQTPVAVEAPATVSGNAVSVLGDATSENSDVTVADAAPVATDGGEVGNAGIGVMSGLQAPVDVTMPLTGSGNAGSVLGDATSSDSTVSVGICQGG